jgi:hypothetical protein
MTLLKNEIKYNHRRLVIVAVSFLLILLTPVSSWAYIGYIRGTVMDTKGQPIGKAEVRTNSATAISLSNGFYLIAHPVGIYTVIASAPGYMSQRKAAVSVFEGAVTVLDFSLSPGYLKLESVYPTLGARGEDLGVTLTGIGFDANTRVSISPDVGNKKAIIGSLDTTGYSQDLVISGTTAYVADGVMGLRIIDISDPTNLTEIAVVDTPHQAWGVALAGSTAYVADGESGLVVINVSDPSAPFIVGSFNTPGFAQAITVSGNTAYVADRESGLQIINIGNPSRPIILGFYDTPGEASDVVVSGSLAYVADSYKGLQIIDVSNPAAPILVGNLDLPGYSSGIFVSGSTVYMATSYEGLRIIKVVNPSTPNLIGSVDTPGWAQSVVVAGTTAYVADGNSGLQIIDVDTTAFSGLKIIGSVNTPGDGRDVWVTDTTAYIADGYDGLQVVDVSNPSSIFIGSVQTSTWAQDVALSGNYAYVTEAGALSPGVTAVDISDPSNPTIVDEKNLGYCYGIEVAGNYAYIANYMNGLTILDISTPYAPTVAGSVNTPGNARDVSVSGTIAAIADGSDLQIIDVSDPENPFIISSVDPDPAASSSVYGVAVSGNTICIAGNSDSGFRVVDISDPYNPTVSNKINVDDSEAIAILGDYAYVSGSIGSIRKLMVVDINPAHPEYLTIVGEVNTTYFAEDITLSGSIAYLANQDQGVQIVDISDPENPTTIGTVDTFSNAMGVAVSGNAAFVADYYSGLAILPIPAEIAPVTVNSDTEIALTIPGPNVAGPYTLRVFNDSQSDEIYSAVSFTDRKQILNSKAIIVAGGGPDAFVDIWAETKLSANKAYDVLLQQGYDHDSIHYLSMENKSDNQYVDDRPLTEVLSTTMSDLTNDEDKPDLLLFFVNHGEPDHFILRASESHIEKLSADELDDMLDTFQDTTDSLVMFIYDGCQSGTFVSKLKPFPGKKRVVITSTSNEPAYFLNQGIESFSFQFWDKILYNEGNVGQAFIAARDIMKAHNQTALLDSDGDGIASEPEDLNEARTLIIRRESPAYSPVQPVIGSVSVDKQTLAGGTSATIQAQGVEYADSVRAQIIPPDINPDTSGSPITDLPSVELAGPENDGVYNGIYNGFTTEGTYLIIVKAIATEDVYSPISGSTLTQNIYSPPVYTSVTQTQITGNQTIKADSYEEDDTPNQASVITINDLDVQPHNCHDIGDVDWVKFYGLSGQTYTFKASNVSVICDTVIELYDSDGTTLLAGPENDGGAGEDEFLDWICPQDKIYYVKVSNSNSNFGENSKYDFEIKKSIGPLSGWVTGMITDRASGLPLGNVQIKTGENHTALSLSSGVSVGEYLMVHPEGPCVLTAQKAGYKPETSSEVLVLEGGPPAILDLELTIIDADGDGLPDIVESAPNSNCLNANDDDTDDDGILDGKEDTDHDGAVDAFETDPCDADTDKDGLLDGTEIGLAAPQGSDTNLGVFIADADPTTTTDPLDEDSDNDGQLDGEEDVNHNGRVDESETNPNQVEKKAMPWIPLLLDD